MIFQLGGVFIQNPEQMATDFSRRNDGVQPENKHVCSHLLKDVGECTQLIFLPFDLIVLAKYKGT